MPSEKVHYSMSIYFRKRALIFKTGIKEYKSLSPEAIKKLINELGDKFELAFIHRLNQGWGLAVYPQTDNTFTLYTREICAFFGEVPKGKFVDFLYAVYDEYDNDKFFYQNNFELDTDEG